MVLSGNDAGLRCLLRLTSFARSDIPSKLSRHPCRKSLSRSCQSRGGSEVALRSAALVLMLREWHLSAKRSRQNAMTSGDRKSHSTLGQFLTPSQRPLTRATPAQDVPAFKVRDALFLRHSSGDQIFIDRVIAGRHFRGCGEAKSGVAGTLSEEVVHRSTVCTTVHCLVTLVV